MEHFAVQYRREEEQFAKSSVISPYQYNINSRPMSAADNSEHNGKLGGRKHGVSESDSVDGGHGPSRKLTRLSSIIKDDSDASSGSGTATPTLQPWSLWRQWSPSVQQDTRDTGPGAPVEADTWHHEPGDPSPRLTGVWWCPPGQAPGQDTWQDCQDEVQLQDCMIARKIIKYLEHLTEFLNNHQDLYLESNYC